MKNSLTIYAFIAAVMGSPLAMKLSAAPAPPSERAPFVLMDALKQARFVDGTPDDAMTSLKGKKVIGLYFTAKWCGPCHAFSPKLVKFRNKHKDDFQFVMVSWDKSLKEQEAYLKKVKMEVPAVRFDDPLVKELGRRFRVRGIPTLLIFDGEGKFLSADGREHMMMPLRPGRMEKELGENTGGKCWLEMTADAQKEQVAKLAEENKVLDPVFEKYKDFPRIMEFRALMGYYGEQAQMRKVLTQMGQDIANDWPNKKKYLNVLLNLAPELKPQAKGYRGILEVKSSLIFEELGRHAVKNPDIVAKFWELMKLNPRVCKKWCMTGLATAAIAGNQECFDKILDYQKSFGDTLAPLSIFPALQQACRENNPRAIELAYKLYQKDSYFVHVAYMMFPAAAYRGNKMALDALAEITHCKKPDYEAAALEVITEVSKDGSEHAAELLKRIKAEKAAPTEAPTETPKP